MRKHFLTFFFALWTIAFIVLAARADRTIASCTFILLAVASVFLAWFFEFGLIKD